MTATEPTTQTQLLLHICCGPCATVVIERLSEEYAVTGYFYNPNIFPPDEYERRLSASRIAAARAGIQLVAGQYEPEVFAEAVRGLESEPENGKRCKVCYRLRLDATASYAAGHGFPIFASTLTTGPRKPAAVINPIGHEVAAHHGIAFLDIDWKKRAGFQRSCELANEFGLYRQHYCGCEFSLRDR